MSKRPARGTLETCRHSLRPAYRTLRNVPQRPNPTAN